MPDFPSRDRIIVANRRFSARFDDADLQVRPKRRLAIVTCMDSRIDAFATFGLANGEAHIIRNAGGVITDDVIRSLCVSQRRMGTREIVLVHHTDCGLQALNEDDFHRELEDELGVKPGWSVEAFSDPYRDVRQSFHRLRMSPFVMHTTHVSGFVYDVTDGSLHPVELEEASDDAS